MITSFTCDSLRCSVNGGHGEKQTTPNRSRPIPSRGHCCVMRRTTPNKSRSTSIGIPQLRMGCSTPNKSRSTVHHLDPIQVSCPQQRGHNPCTAAKKNGSNIVSFQVSLSATGLTPLQQEPLGGNYSELVGDHFSGRTRVIFTGFFPGGVVHECRRHDERDAFLRHRCSKKIRPRRIAAEKIRKKRSKWRIEAEEIKTIFRGDC